MAEPGWYPDPYGRAESRWFDGARWTAHVVSGGATSVEPTPLAPSASDSPNVGGTWRPPAAGPRPSADDHPPAPRRPSKRWLAFGIVAVLAVTAGIVIAVRSDGDEVTSGPTTCFVPMSTLQRVFPGIRVFQTSGPLMVNMTEDMTTESHFATIQGCVLVQSVNGDMLTVNTVRTADRTLFDEYQPPSRHELGHGWVSGQFAVAFRLHHDMTEMIFLTATDAGIFQTLTPKLRQLLNLLGD